MANKCVFHSSSHINIGWLFFLKESNIINVYILYIVLNDLVWDYQQLKNEVWFHLLLLEVPYNIYIKTKTVDIQIIIVNTWSKTNIGPPGMMCIPDRKRL